MYCQHCGKELNANADVCLSCGTFVKNQGKNKSKNNSRCLTVVEIFNLCFSGIFSLISIIVLGMETTNALSLWGNANYYDSGYISIELDTNLYVMLAISLIALAISSIVSILLYKTSRKNINIVSYFVSVGTILLLAIMFWLYILVNS